MSLGSPRKGISLWQTTAVQEAPRTALAAPLRADVVIVGGGVVGMSTALHIAEAGGDVLVLDAGQDNGRTCASLASGGLIAPQLLRGTPDSLCQELGKGLGSRFVNLVAHGGQETFDLIERHALRCDPSPNGFLAPFRENQRDACARVVESWTGWRDDVALLDGPEAARLTGTVGYAGAILDRSGGSLNPLAYARELGRRAQELGARIQRDSHVRSIEYAGPQTILQLNSGQVVADKVILAANGSNMKLASALDRSLLPLNVREVATVPLPEDLRRSILPEGHAMTDRGPDIFTIRYDGDGRLITSATMPWGHSFSALEKAVNARLSRFLPSWRYTRLDHAWTGTAWLNTDIQPRYVQVAPNALAVQACNGRGLALAAPIGRDLAAWARGTADELALPLRTPKQVSFYALARRLPNIALGLAAIKGRLAA